MLQKFYRSRYFIIANFLLLAFFLYHFVMAFSSQIIKHFGPKEPYGQFEWAYNFSISSITIGLMFLTGFSIYWLEKSKKLEDNEYKKGYLITVILLIIAFISFEAMIIFKL